MTKTHPLSMNKIGASFDKNHPKIQSTATHVGRKRRNIPLCDQYIRQHFGGEFSKSPSNAAPFSAVLRANSAGQPGARFVCLSLDAQIPALTFLILPGNPDMGPTSVTDDMTRITVNYVSFIHDVVVT